VDLDLDSFFFSRTNVRLLIKSPEKMGGGVEMGRQSVIPCEEHLIDRIYSFPPVCSPTSEFSGRVVCFFPVFLSTSRLLF